jgi:hypothetical protein
MTVVLARHIAEKISVFAELPMRMMDQPTLKAIQESKERP